MEPGSTCRAHQDRVQSQTAVLKGCAAAQCRLLMQAAHTLRPNSATALGSSSLRIASRESCFDLVCMELPCTTNPLRCLHHITALGCGRRVLNIYTRATGASKLTA